MMKRAGYILLSLLLCSVPACSNGGDDGGGGGGGPLTDSCDLLGLKIINGTPCRDDGSPVVRFVVKYTNRDDTLCSGTMITPTHVLTAGHCFIDLGENVTSITVTAGDEDIPAVDFAIHPGYHEGPADVPIGAAIYNDVAIVRLFQPAFVPTVPIVTSGPVLEGDIIGIFGYGLDENDNIGQLQSGEMQVDDVTTDFIISEFDGEGSNTCVGDSGGPAILEFADVSGNIVTGIVGVTSSGDPRVLCEVGDVSVFTNLQDPSNLSFIRNFAPGVQTT
jgi:secreted trypsin-like serine protease